MKTFLLVVIFIITNAYVYSTITIAPVPGEAPHATWHRIQTNIMAAQLTGEDIYIMPGKYTIDQTLVINGFAGYPAPYSPGHAIKITGSGWSYDANNIDNRKGTWIEIAIPYAANGLLITSPEINGTIIRDIAFYYSTPNNDFLINISGSCDVRLENLLLFNPRYGIRLYAADRAILDGIFGDPVYVGIDIDMLGDTIFLNNIKFWPYSKSNEDIKIQQGIGIISRRVDNPFYSSIAMYGYYTGILFTMSGNGRTQKFHLSNIDLAKVNYGIVIQGTLVSGQISDCTIQGKDDYGSIGIFTSGQQHNLQICNLSINRFNQDCIRIESSYTTLLLENSWFQDWNHWSVGYPAIEVTGPGEQGTVINVGKAYFKRNSAYYYFNDFPYMGFNMNCFRYNDNLLIKEQF